MGIRGLSLSSRTSLDLSGEWHYRLIGAPSSIPAEGIISFPNTLDNARKSIYNPLTDNTEQLRREFSFVGEAIYSRNIRIPNEWRDKEIFLEIERSKPSRIKIDGKDAGYNSRISSPQKYNLSHLLSPGDHHIEIIVNNADSLPPMVARTSNAASEASQTNWNGIIGNFSLIAKNPIHIRNIRVNEVDHGKGVNLMIDLSDAAPEEMKLGMSWKNNSTITKTIEPGDTCVKIYLPLKKEDLWSEHKPRLHNLRIKLADKEGKIVDEHTTSLGFREFINSGKAFYVNETPTFLRGTVNSAIFPETTYSPTDLKSWQDYFKVIKDYGLNHVRFHSWTPPDAAFTAADQEGVYLLVELPIWGELDRDLKNHNLFLNEELKGIMESYSHHPSFVMFSPGNELWGDVSLMREYMEKSKKLNPRILSTYGSNVYLGMRGEIGGEDFIIASKTGDGPKDEVRGSFSFADDPTGGLFNSTYPETQSNYDLATGGINVPMISHEVGQYQSYPDFTGLDRYKSNLKPDNLLEFKRQAEEAGKNGKSKLYSEATGKWVAKLYKAEIEKAMRSEGIAGIELMSLQDNPGQGTALVGILNPFMESKGYITPEKWRESYSDRVVLAEFPRFTFREGEDIEIPVRLINYSDTSLSSEKIEWTTPFLSGEIVAEEGRGIIPIKLPGIKEPQKMSLILTGDEGKIRNEYEFWVYPENKKNIKNVIVTKDISEALRMLEKGKKVILMADSSKKWDNSIGGLFTPDFWNYSLYNKISEEMHLPSSPGSLGLLIDRNHPAFNKFPTDIHTDWQWYAIVRNSQPLKIEMLPKSYEPIVEVVDNIDTNRRVALIFECNVGKGKLLIVASDLEKGMQFPEVEWLLQSLKEYVASKEFKPRLSLSARQLKTLLRPLKD